MTTRNLRRGIGLAIVYAMVGLLVVLLVVAIAQQSKVLDAIRSSQQDRAPILDSTAQSARDTARSTRLIESCLLPNRPCSRRAARNTAHVLGQVADVQIYVAICESRHPHTTSVDEIRTCVHTLAAADQH